MFDLSAQEATDCVEGAWELEDSFYDNVEIFRILGKVRNSLNMPARDFVVAQRPIAALPADVQEWYAGLTVPSQEEQRAQGVEPLWPAEAKIAFG